MAVNGQVKGRKFEVEVCRVLTHWLTDDYKIAKGHADMLPVRRRFTTTKPLDGTWKGYGDVLVSPKYAMPFTVECKRIEGWALDDVFSPRSKIWQWWSQAVNQANETNDILGYRKKDQSYPLLVISRNHCEPLMMVPDEDRWRANFVDEADAARIVVPDVIINNVDVTSFGKCVLLCQLKQLPSIPKWF